MKQPITLLFSFLFFAAKISAQNASKNIFYLSEDNRAVNINCIFKSLAGFIYTGTHNGLYKFDGESFSKIYFKNKDYSDTVTAITEDQSKIIWVGFKSGRLGKVENGLLMYVNPEEGTPSSRISCMTTDSRNNLWYAAYGEGLYYTFNNHHYLLNDSNGFKDISISSVCKTKNQDVLAGTDQGLAVCRAGNKQVKFITTANGLPDYIITHISPSTGNKFWIALQDKGFCLYDHNTGEIKRIPAVNDWPYGQINFILQEENNLWIATQAHGLIQYQIETGKLNIENFSGFTDIHQLLKDDQGNIWHSSHENILAKSMAGTVQILPYYDEGFFEKIHAILFDHNANIWVNEDKAIVKFSHKNGKLFSHHIPIPTLDYKTDITALYQDKFNTIWIGTMGKGIYLLNTADNSIRHLSSKPSLNSASVLSITGKGDSIFICSLQGATLVKLHRGNTQAGRYSFSGFDNFAGSNFIYSIFKDSRGRLWFATDGNGLSMLDKDNKFIQITDTRLLEARHIYSVTEDHLGNIWFSTAASGVYKYDGLSFKNYGLKNGLSDLYISVVKTLQSGYIAVINKKGIDLINPKTGLVSYVGSNLGIGQLNADNLGATTIDSSGYLLATGSNGIVRYDVPAGSTQQPVTIIESVQLFLNNIDTSNRKVFAHDENNFSFNFIGLYYTDPASVYYQYKLEGLDSNWINTRDRNLIFPKLPPGKYCFKVRSSLNKSFDHAQEASFYFEIKQAFYKTWWFILSSFGLAGLIISLYIRNREKELKKIQQLQQEKIQFRLEVLRNQVNPHFLFNSFNTLISTIEENPKGAVEYTEQLSDFFRNIVTYRDKDTISLEEELSLLQTYFFLQQKRYGNNLKLFLNIPEHVKKGFNIPPLTLQLLLENAIKHNAVSRDNPLEVFIELDEKYTLTVSNLKNKRNIIQSGAGMGLQNIKNRFKLLTNRSVIIQNNEQLFKVYLPLIPNDNS